MPIIDKMNKLEEITKDEQEKGAARLDELGIHNVGETIQDVMENIPNESGSGFSVQADWNQNDSEAPDYIKNKPEIPPFLQLSVLPEAMTVPEGTIVQYIGETMEHGYHHGWYYESKHMPGEPPGYRSWRNIQVDDLDAKQDNIYVSPALTLSVEGWDAETMKQTVWLPSKKIETTFKTTFDLSPEAADNWAKAHISISEYYIYSDGVTRKNYWDAFEFVCEALPTEDISFTLTAFKANRECGLYLPYMPSTDVSGKQNIVLDTPLTIGGVSRTSVEAALGALNDVKAESFDATVTLAAASWTGASAPYTQTVNVTGIIATDKPIIDVVVSSTVATGIDEIADFAKITKAETGAGTITFSCYEDKPSNDLTVAVKVVR